jgi:zinc transporter ZupT
MEIAVLALAGSGTALATGIGALPVSRLGARADLIRPALWGLTVGLMTVASVVGLLLPALDEGSLASVAAGLATGTAFLLASRRLLMKRDVHVGQLSGAGVRRSVLVFAVCWCTACRRGLRSGPRMPLRRRASGSS